MLFPQPLTLQQVAGFVNARFKGDPNHPVKGINEIHMVEPGDLTFVDHPKYYDKALNSRATTVLINKRVERPEGKALVFHDKPFDAFISLILRFRPFERALATISPTAKIGEGTIIQPGAFVGNHVTIGKNCLIHSNVSIYDHCVIGDDVIIHANTCTGCRCILFSAQTRRLPQV
jgi:UDP-3-O-[3-hydroxymyristoyl] glucosamine N-acyltransferase